MTHHLRPGHLRILAALSAAAKPLTVNETALAAKMFVPTVAQWSAQLETWGFITRHGFRKPGHKSTVTAQITDAGRAALADGPKAPVAPPKPQHRVVKYQPLGDNFSAVATPEKSRVPVSLPAPPWENTL